MKWLIHVDNDSVILETVSEVRQKYGKNVLTRRGKRLSILDAYFLGLMATVKRLTFTTFQHLLGSYMWSRLMKPFIYRTKKKASITATWFSH